MAEKVYPRDLDGDEWYLTGSLVAEDSADRDNLSIHFSLRDENIISMPLLEGQYSSSLSPCPSCGVGRPYSRSPEDHISHQAQI